MPPLHNRPGSQYLETEVGTRDEANRPPKWGLEGAVQAPSQMALPPGPQGSEGRSETPAVSFLCSLQEGRCPHSGRRGGEKTLHLPPTHLHAHAHTHTRTHTHTHTHTLMPRLQACPPGCRPWANRKARGGQGGGRGGERVTRPGDGDRGYPVQR